MHIDNHCHRGNVNHIVVVVSRVTLFHVKKYHVNNKKMVQSMWILIAVCCCNAILYIIETESLFGKIFLTFCLRRYMMSLIICQYLKNIYENLQFNAVIRVPWLFCLGCKFDVNVPSWLYSSAFFLSDLLYYITSLIVMRTRGCYCSHVVFLCCVGRSQGSL